MDWPHLNLVEGDQFAILPFAELELQQLMLEFMVQPYGTSFGLVPGGNVLVDEQGNTLTDEQGDVLTW